MKRNGQGATRKERLMRAKMKKKQQEEENDPNATSSSAFFEDILQMSDLSEKSLLENLKKRYDKDLIYTYVGPILIAINPYKPLDTIYNEESMTEYYGKAMGTLPPHVFALADHAYTQLIQGGALNPANQSIIISGESGAGKTETTKIIMQYLARATSCRKTGSETYGSNTVSHALGKLEEKVLESNPLLESFGNAKTLRNDNSSRFGKFIEIQFDHHGKIVGAEIMNFLLEKTRIVTQCIGERNYHIFYQLLAGANEKQRQRLHLNKNPEDYEYLKFSKCFEIKSCDDKKQFETTKHCMTLVGISEEQQEKVFDLLAAILHLGNVQFLDNHGDVSIDQEKSKETFGLVANLLKLSVDALETALLKRKLFVGGKVIVQNQQMHQVRDKRDALAKSVYSSLFLWLVTELNCTISKPTSKWGFIGVLDIYGFEKFDWNTFEQLCINYANEKLQRHFNQHMLEVEQEEYTKEGIDWKHIDFIDNQNTLDLIEGKPNGKPGIFITLDDIWRLKGEEANKKFVSILHSNFGHEANNSKKCQHVSYFHPKVDAALHFGIKHYAGQVIYDASGFNDKNNETLNDDMKDLMRESESQWVREIFDLNMASMDAIPGNTKRAGDHSVLSRRPSDMPSSNSSSTTSENGPGTPNSKSRNLREVSVGTQFRYQLQELINKISLANPRYVRCIKPNEHKVPGDLDDTGCVRQLKYSGMMEAIQIRRRGFALREDHDVFFYDYQSLAPEAETIQDLVEEISTNLGAGKEEWQLGKTKVFLKRGIALKLQKLEILRCKAAARALQRWCRNMKRSVAAVKLQAIGRRFLAKRRLRKLKHAGHLIRALLRARVASVKYQALLEEYREKNEVAVQLQKIARGFLIRKQNLLRPFEGLSSKELDEKIAQVEKEIALAAQQKQFEKCFDLQKDLEKIVEARKKVRTKKEIDQEISLLNAQLDQAAAKKEFGKCADLQAQIEELKAFRSQIKEDLNEMEPFELDEKIAEVEKQIKQAMASREFEKCGQLQEELDQLVAARKKKLTPQELNVEIQKLNAKLSELMAQKDFGSCADVQKEIDVLTKRRAKMKTPPTSSSSSRVIATGPPAAAASLPSVVAASVAPVSAKQVVTTAVPTVATSPAPTVSTPTKAQPTVVSATASPVTAAAAVAASTKIVATPSPARANHPVMRARQLSDGGENFEQRPRSGSASSQVSVTKSTISVASVSSKKPKKSEATDASRTVERLRPAKPLTVSEDMSIAEASKLMKFHRAAAVIVTDTGGGLSGILTDTDTARRVVSKGLDPNTTLMRDVMTPRPRCVSMEDSAMDALDIMLGGRFRHLPVVQNGQVVGLLNVAKCLHDAIKRIENASSSLKQELAGAASSSNNVLRTMLEKMLSPTLKDALAGETKAPLVLAADSIASVTEQIAATKKPALVVSDSSPAELIGIFTPKDLLHRVIAAGLDVNATTVGQVMTPNPEYASPETTVLDAFHIMHDGKFLNLPVVCNSTNEIFGIADVLSLACTSLGQTESHSVGKFWSLALDFDADETASNATSITSKAKLKHKEQDKHVNIRPVSSLRPSAAVTITGEATIVDAASLMKQKRSDALLVVDAAGALVGILTDTDICRRVLAQELDPEQTQVSAVMTQNIKYVAPQDSAIDALLMMQEGHFRHLPVVERDTGMISGVLNIGKCLYDVSKRLEHAINSSEQLKASIEQSNALSTSSSAMQQLLAPLLQKLTSPTLASILQNQQQQVAAGKAQAAPRVTKDSSVRDAVKLMATTRQAALVVDANDDKKLCGLFSPNELVMKVIAKKLDPSTTSIEKVMLRDPETATSATSVLDALHIMHDSKCLNLPVVGNAQLVGLVDVLALSYGTIDAIYGSDQEQMQEFWNTALQLDQPAPAPASEAPSSRKKSKREKSNEPGAQRTVVQLRPSQVLTVLESQSVSDVAMLMGRNHADCALVVSSDGLLAGIITDTDLTRRVVSENRPLESTMICDVMTRNPKFVSMEDPAIEALCTMLEGKFRHLPVIDQSKGGIVVGILNIAKCLYDAIRKMEKAEQSTTALRESLGKNAAALSHLLGPMVDKIFSPTVQSVLKEDTVEPPRVQPYTSVYEVAKQMAVTKKAALVVSTRTNQFFGLFTPKDLLEKVLAKGLPVHTTPVCEVMGEDAVSIQSNTTVIDAMHAMHDQKTLYLAVMNASHQAIGLVDVLSLSYGSFAKGKPSDWKAFWNASFDMAGGADDEDSVDGNSSTHSLKTGPQKKNSGATSSTRQPSSGSGDSRPVSKLRPTKTVTILDTCTVADAAKEMLLSHTDAALVISTDGMLRGILTDTDVTRRVIALGNDPIMINVCDAMTPNPKFVHETDSAMDAMFMMLEGKFRHLPVVDTQGMVAGMLRIQKCLYDAITRLEKAQHASSGALRENLEKQLISSLGAVANTANIQQMLAPMVDKMLSPSLESIIQSDAHLPPLVYGTETITEVARQMAASRKAALIVEDDKSIKGSNSLTAGKRLIGVFTPKDLLLRVVGSGLDASTTSVSQVMTPKPETAAPTMSLVDALHVMHDHKFLHLPVVQEAGLILGLVDVLTLCYGTFAKGSDSSDWRSFWDMSLALTRDDESDAGSVSVGGSRVSKRAKTPGSGKGPTSRHHAVSSTGSASRKKSDQEEGARPVSKLRPRPVTCINEFITVTEAAKKMRQARVEAVVVTTEEGELRGILTDTDITRRVLAKEMDPDTCSVASVMTANPSCVRMDDQAIEAITKMMEGRFKHLPVVGEDGVIQGMLDISKCLYDAITCMEKVQQSTEAAASDFSKDLEGAASQLQRLLGPLMEKMVRPTVATALEGEPKPPIVQVNDSVQKVAKLMADTKKAAIVMDENEIVGMLTPKDLLRKLVAKNLPAEYTFVEEVMSADPETITPDARILDGLRLMHDAGQLFMPVLKEDNQVYGMADVLCLSYGQFTNATHGNGDWRSFWQTALNLQEEAGNAYDPDETTSIGTIEEFERNEYRHLASAATPMSRFSNLGGYSELGESVSVVSATHTTTTSNLLSHAPEDAFVFKVSDHAHGHYHRILCRYDKLLTLVDQVRTKMGTGLDANDDIRLKYEDDDGDLAVLSNDESLIEAVNMAKLAGWKRLVLLVDIIPGQKKAPASSLANKQQQLAVVDEDDDESVVSTGTNVLSAIITAYTPKSTASSTCLVVSKQQEQSKQTHSGNGAIVPKMSPTTLSPYKRQKERKKNLMVAGAGTLLLGLGAAAMIFLKKKN